MQGVENSYVRPGKTYAGVIITCVILENNYTSSVQLIYSNSIGYHSLLLILIQLSPFFHLNFCIVFDLIFDNSDHKVVF